jgi:transposase
MCMASRQFQLTPQQIEELGAYERCTDCRMRVRCWAVRLYGYSVSEIKALTGCSRTSLMEWCRRYRTQGSQGLHDKHSGGNRAKLTREDIREISKRLHKHSPGDLLGVSSHPADLWTIKDLQQIVRQWYGLRYRSYGSYRRLFMRCGFRYDPTVRAFRPAGESQWSRTT